jgi:hypothetical protein
MIEEAGLDTLEYSKRWGYYRLRLTADDIAAKAAVLKKLIRAACDKRALL